MELEAKRNKMDVNIEFNELHKGDKIDYRHDNGKYMEAKIIEKTDNKINIQYHIIIDADEDEDEKQHKTECIEIEIKLNGDKWERIAKYESVSKRKANRP